MPGKGDFTKLILEDLAILTGGYLFDESEPEQILKCKIEHLGFFKFEMKTKNSIFS